MDNQTSQKKPSRPRDEFPAQEFGFFSAVTLQQDYINGLTKAHPISGDKSLLYPRW